MVCIQPFDFLHRSIALMFHKNLPQANPDPADEDSGSRMALCGDVRNGVPAAMFDQRKLQLMEDVWMAILLVESSLCWYKMHFG
ncbi:hypothetical protein CEXT_334691 [Caerostris extrusa]|uniref:Uncharacterized protein n=1 Tax=Caerostris extrusa TaxID=172846 RepID=A0AAV4NZI3_CAEEX|nr:hypothetical protein CEXT_334691 [Caerostris extrusa]